MKQEDRIREERIHALSFHPKKRLGIFSKLSIEDQAETLLNLSRHVQYDLVHRLKERDLVRLLEWLDPDEATDIIQLFARYRQKELIQMLGKEMRHGLEVLTQFDPATAAGLMNIDYIQVLPSASVREVSEQYRKHERRTGRPPTMIISEHGCVLGYVPGHVLGFSRPSEKIKKHIKKIRTLAHNASHDDVIDLFRTHPHNKIAVIGNGGNVMGIIYSDDILRLVNEKESASLYDFAGVNDEESITDGARRKVRHRYKWLIVNLATAFLAASVVRLFEETIAKYVLLAIYMPIVAGMGGNASTQTLAVMVRGIALNQITLKNVWPTLKHELEAGLMNGAINGILVFLIVVMVHGNVVIAGVLAMAMIINLLVAAFFGTMIPLVMRHFGKDPATSATIFITTATDVLGFLAFLGLAKWLLI